VCPWSSRVRASPTVSEKSSISSCSGTMVLYDGPKNQYGLEVTVLVGMVLVFTPTWPTSSPSCEKNIIFFPRRAGIVYGSINIPPPSFSSGENPQSKVMSSYSNGLNATLFISLWLKYLLSHGILLNVAWVNANLLISFVFFIPTTFLASCHEARISRCFYEGFWTSAHFERQRAYPKYQTITIITICQSEEKAKVLLYYNP